MRVVILGATGATGRLLVSGALDRGLAVTAIARDPRAVEPRPGLTVVRGDVHDPTSIAVEGDVLLSGLGLVRESPPLTLTAGARAAVASGVPRVIWLGAFGTGRSASAASAVTRAVLTVALRRELPDKVAADNTVLDAGGTVFHAGPLTNRPVSTHPRAVPVAEAPRRLFPATVSRANVAATMLDEAQNPQFPGTIAVPL
ncbi:SDR family oxidoreductase [Actinoplanes sp. LDG1-06]|uniref:SDR family oxidoreductase n=1 Tax=Paractinoplanes ovalisporus TaxID=2810368 RepID=A0ABS2A2X7_9ACTN|nr:NAD(P)-binding oxidoreductase [Actinoplanes ovalisporus]MBM2614169.1 SDR family oxidoreductase [Actinoplanes ovalisporus]